MKNKKIKHIILTRLALKGEYSNTGFNWDEWLENSIYLMNTICRPSLKNQIDQDFILLSFVDNSVNYYGDILENEMIIKVYNKNLISYVNKYISENLKNYEYIIITRLDRDDALRYDFIQNIKKNILIDNEEKYIDIKYSICYDLDNNMTYFSKKYFNNFISPFVSTLEKIVNGKIKCVPFLVQHPDVHKILPGEKNEDLLPIQTIHQYNLKNKIFGDQIDINKKDFGL